MLVLLQEPFDTTNAVSSKPVTPAHKPPMHLVRCYLAYNIRLCYPYVVLCQVSTGSADNYDVSCSVGLIRQ